jgi:hypothetical protein
MNGLNFPHQSKLRDITTIFHSRTLKPIVQSRLRHFHWIIHVTDGHSNPLNLYFRVGDSPQTLKELYESGNNIKRIIKPSYRFQFDLQSLTHFIHANYPVMESTVDGISLGSQIASSIQKNRI